MSKYPELEYAAAAGKLKAFQGMARLLDLAPLHRMKAEAEDDSNTSDIIYLLEALREEDS